MERRRDRIDALEGEAAARLRVMTGGLVESDPDAELQAVVESAARAAGTPIALISLIMRRTQLFRAQVGLGGELALASGVDRCVSFCQFVVRDRAPFTVEDARLDDRVPQQLVDSHGIRAYLGVPVDVDGQTVGALCVADTVPRVFGAAEREALLALAALASRRLSELAVAPSVATRAMLGQATSPAFHELRNLLSPLLVNLEGARLAIAELAPLVRLAAAARTMPDGGGSLWAALADAPHALDDLRDALADAESCSLDICDTVVALEQLLAGDRGAGNAGDAMRTATQLSHHVTKLIGGVACDGALADVPLAASTAAATCALAAAFAAVATRVLPLHYHHGLRVAVEATATGALRVAIRAPGALESCAAACARELAPLLAAGPVTVGEAGGAVVLDLPRA